MADTPALDQVRHAANIGGVLAIVEELTTQALNEIREADKIAGKANALAAIGTIMSTAERLDAAAAMLRSLIAAHRAGVGR